MTRGQTLQLFKSREDARPVAAFNGLTRRTLAFTERIMLTEYELPAGKGADLHTHTVDEIAYLVRGRARVSFRGETYEVKAGDSWVVPAGDSHELLAHEDSLCVFAFSPMRPEYAEDNA